MKIVIILISILIFIILVSSIIGYKLLNPSQTPIIDEPDSELNYQEVQFSSRDKNITLSGWYFEKKSKKNREATVIMAHGYGDNRLQNGIALDLTTVFIDEGYDVLLFDFRGSGESDDYITTVGQFEQKDLQGAVDFIKNINNSRIIVHGFSMGASTALITAGKDNRIDAVIADSPFYDLSSYLNTNLSKWTYLPDLPFNWLILNLLMKFTKFNPDLVSPVQAVRNFNIPLLLIHGTEDDLIGVENSKKLMSAAPDNLTEHILISGADHVEGYNQNSDYYVNVLLEFLNNYF